MGWGDVFQPSHSSDLEALFLFQFSAFSSRPQSVFLWGVDIGRGFVILPVLMVSGAVV